MINWFLIALPFVTSLIFILFLLFLFKKGYTRLLRFFLVQNAVKYSFYSILSVIFLPILLSILLYEILNRGKIEYIILLILAAVWLAFYIVRAVFSIFFFKKIRKIEDEQYEKKLRTEFKKLRK